jgi:hypothetical protein
VVVQWAVVVVASAADVVVEVASAVDGAEDLVADTAVHREVVVQEEQGEFLQCYCESCVADITPGSIVAEEVRHAVAGAFSIRLTSERYALRTVKDATLGTSSLFQDWSHGYLAVGA